MLLPSRVARALLLPLVLSGSVLAPAMATAESPGATPAPTTPALHSRTAGTPDTEVDATRAALNRIERSLTAVDGPPPQSRSASSGRPDLTLDLLRLQRGLGSLAPREAERARILLLRPTDGFADPLGLGYGRNARPRSDCRVRRTRGSHVCVTWASRGVDRPPPGDADRDGVPNQVERTRDVVNYVWKRLVTRGGYRAPRPDKGHGRQGPDRRLDVYLKDIGSYGYYGYCSIDAMPVRGTGRDAPAYCVLDDDYSPRQFPFNSPRGNLQVTAAHEFFHAVQFAYDINDDDWFMEGTAAWVEDELYDAVNDNLNYLDRSQLSHPWKSLDYNGDSQWHPYGSWVFWRFLTESFPASGSSGLPLVMRSLWGHADNAAPGSTGTYSLRALQRALVDRGSSVADVFAAFSAANRHPTPSYSEGASYLDFLSPPNRTWTVTSEPHEATWILDHLSSASVALRPDVSGSSNDILRLEVDAEDGVPFAATVTAAGQATPVVIPLDDSGDGAVELPFDPALIDDLQITLSNTSTRLDCGHRTRYSCGGVATDDASAVTLRAWVPAP